MIRLPHNNRSRIQLALVVAFLAVFFVAVRFAANRIEAAADFWELEHAVYVDDLEQLERQLRESADVDVRAPETRETALHVAAKYGRLDAAKHLLDHGADPNATDADLTTPLLIAVGTSDELANLLIEHGANVNSADDPGTTPLHYAADLGKMDIVRTLIDHGALLHTWAAPYGNTPAGTALSRGHVKIAEYILFDAGEGDLGKEKPADLAAYALADLDFDLMRRIIDAAPTSIAPIVAAVARGSLEDVRAIVATGDPIGDSDGYAGVPILALAAMLNEHEIVEYLLDYGLDPNHNLNSAPAFMPDPENGTALHAAARTDAAEAARVLIERGADVNEVTSANLTPVHVAVRSSSKNVLELLLKEDADLRIPAHHMGPPRVLAEQRARESERPGVSEEQKANAQAILDLIKQHTE